MPSQEGKKISLNTILTSLRTPGYPSEAVRGGGGEIDNMIVKRNIKNCTLINLEI